MVIRRLLFVVLAAGLVCGVPAFAQADVSVTQVKVDASATPFVTDGIDDLAFDASVAAGSFVCAIVSVTASSRDFTSATDDGGNTYTLASQGGVDATSSIAAVSEVWIYCAPISTTMQTVTVTLSNSVASPALYALIEMDGQHGTTPIEDVAIATTNGTTHSSGDLVTAAAGSALIGIIYGTTGNYDQDADFTAVAEDAQGLIGYDLVGAATSTMEVTSAATEDAVRAVIAVQPAAAAGGGNQGLLLGVGVPGDQS